MTASSTPVTLANRALLQIGARATIVAFNEGSTEANACNALYVSTFEQIARSAPWNCLRQQQSLTLYQAATGTPENPDGTLLSQPPTPWLYSYLIPANCLDVRFLVPSLPATATGSPPITTVNNLAPTLCPGEGEIAYAVVYGEDVNHNPLRLILTNQTQAQLVYTIDQPQPQIWDSLFEQAFVSALAVFLVPALALNLGLMDRCAKASDSAIAQARVRDGNESFVTQDHAPDWLRVRASGTTLYTQNGLSPNAYANYLNPVWPIG